MKRRKVIDNRGRLFEFINIFDLLVLCAILFAAIVAVKWAFVAEDPSWVKLKFQHTRCIAFMNMETYKAKLAKVGDEAVNDDGVTVARIEKILSTVPVAAAVYKNKAGEEMVFYSGGVTVTIILNVLSYEKKGMLYSALTGSPLLIGESFMMTTKEYTCQAVIRDVLRGEAEANGK